MNEELRCLIIEIKKTFFRTPAIISYFVLTVFLAKLLIKFFGFGNATYAFTTFLPLLTKICEGISKSQLTNAFMNWWGGLPFFVHWFIVDIFIYYFFIKAYSPRIWKTIQETTRIIP